MGDDSSTGDEQLSRAARVRGDLEKTAQVQGHCELALRYARLMCGNAELAADVAQEAILKLFRAGHLHADTTRSHVWVAVKFSFIEYLRQRRRRFEAQHFGDELLATVTDDAPPPEETQWWALVSQELEKVIAGLEELQQQLVVEVLLSGRPVAAICRDLGVSRSKADLALRKAEAKVERWWIRFVHTHGHWRDKATVVKARDDKRTNKAETTALLMRAES